VQATGSFTATTPGVNFQYCTSETPSAVAPNGTVTFAGVAGASFTPPGDRNVTYNKFLPNVGLSYSPFGKEHQIYASFAQTLSSPKTDNLYNGGFQGGVYSTFDTNVKPETATEYTLGYRYAGERFHASLTAWAMQFKNRIVSTFDPLQGISVDHNIGPVNLAGVDLESEYSPVDDLDFYGSASYEHSRVVNNLPLGNASATTKVDGVTVLPGQVGLPYYAHTAGKEFVETPDWTFSGRVTYRLAGFRFGLGAKYVGRRFASEDNGYRVPDYYVVNGDVSYDLASIGLENTSLQFNVDNLLNKHYFGSVGTSRSCFTPLQSNVTTGCTSYPFLSVGSPQTVQITLRTVF
jgi:iron complex outermembrane receptor protein